MKVSPKKAKPTASISPQQILMPQWCVWGQVVQNYDTRFTGPWTKNAKLSLPPMSVRGEINEAHLLTPLIDQHQTNTGKTVKTAVADSKYGTIDNYLACGDRRIAPHFESFDKGHRGTGTRKGIFEPSSLCITRMKIFLSALPVNCLNRANLKRSVTILSIHCRQKFATMCA